MASGLTGNLRVPVAFGPDGRWLAAALSLQAIHLLDATTAAPVAVLTPPLVTNLVTLAFSNNTR